MKRTLLWMVGLTLNVGSVRSSAARAGKRHHRHLAGNPPGRKVLRTLIKISRTTAN